MWNHVCKGYKVIAGYKITVISNLFKNFDLCNLKYLNKTSNYNKVLNLSYKL